MNWHDWPRCPCTEISYSLSILPWKQNNAKIWFNLSNLCASPKPNLRKLRLEELSACSRGITWCNMVSVYIAYRTIQPFSSFSELLVAPTRATRTAARRNASSTRNGGRVWLVEVTTGGSGQSGGQRLSPPEKVWTNLEQGGKSGQRISKNPC